MHFLLHYLAFLTLVTTVLATPLCNSKIPFYDKCNVCVCSDHGKSMSCTKMRCELCNYDMLGNCVQKTYKGLRRFHGFIRCQPKKTFEMRCNTCICDSTGQSAICTDKFCGHDEFSEYYSNFKCRSGQMYRRDCNACICDSSGYNAVCTQLKCNTWHLPLF